MTDGSPPVSMRIVATAGHVDHGKTTLVGALTGSDTDRLPEERRRGMSIDLGFAWTELGDVGWVAFVDVPGHVDFIRTMIAGVAVIEAAVLVIDAREGWQAQTFEHLLVLRSAGVLRVVAAVTKASLVSEERCVAIAIASRYELQRAGLEGRVVVCDAKDGRGLDDLRQALRRELSDLPAAPDTGRPRLWVDRSFHIPGAGTIVTGGLAHGSIAHDEQVMVIGQRGARRARVRTVEVLGTRRARALPGGRTALNLSGLNHRDVGRGDAVVRDGEWHLTSTFDGTLLVSERLAHPVGRRGAYTVHLGTWSSPARVRLVGSNSVAPGDKVSVRIHVKNAVPLVSGDRFVLTESGRSETIGGGEVLDVEPVVPASRARPDRSVDRIIEERGWVDADHLARLTGVRRAANVGRWVVSGSSLAQATAALCGRVAAESSGELTLQSLDERDRALIAVLQERGRVTVDHGGVRLASDREREGSRLRAALLRELFLPPSPADVGATAGDVSALRRQQLAITLDGRTFASEAVGAAALVVERLLAEHPGGVSVSAFKVEARTSRKWALPLLEHLDAIGATRRVGGLRFEGPRLRQVATGRSTQDGR